MERNDRPAKVKTTETVFRIIDYLCEHDGARVTDIAADLGMSASTAHRHVATLYDMGYTVKDDNRYQLSLRFLNYGIQTQARNPAYKLVKEKVRDLARDTGERVQFVIEEQGMGVWLCKESGENAVDTQIMVGKRNPIHISAAGKAILAHSPEKRVNAIIEKHGLEKMTENTITTEQALKKEMATIREKQYAVNRQEQLDGLRAMGVPICGKNNEVLGAISVSGPIRRLEGEWFNEELPNQLLGTANELEINIRYLDHTE